MAINGTITVGTYLAYAGLVIWLIFPLRNLGRLIVQISTGLVSYSRVMEIIRQENGAAGRRRLPARRRVSRARSSSRMVGFEYDENTPVLTRISFTCQPGQVIALLGSTGSGKTTLVNLLPRFYDYTSGSLRWMGSS